MEITIPFALFLALALTTTFLFIEVVFYAKAEAKRLKAENLERMRKLFE